MTILIVNIYIVLSRLTFSHKISVILRTRTFKAPAHVKAYLHLKNKIGSEAGENPWFHLRFSKICSWITQTFASVFTRLWKQRTCFISFTKSLLSVLTKGKTIYKAYICILSFLSCLNSYILDTANHIARHFHAS